jgi:hypothetical protein
LASVFVIEPNYKLKFSFRFQAVLYTVLMLWQINVSTKQNFTVLMLWQINVSTKQNFTEF